MTIIRSYNQPTVEARGIPGATLPANAPLGAFGNTMQMEGDAKALLLAGEQLGKASDATAKIVSVMNEEAAKRAQKEEADRLKALGEKPRSERARRTSATPAMTPFIRAYPGD